MTTTPVVRHETLDHDVERIWLDDGNIMVLRMPRGAHREAIDTWFDTLTDAAENWDQNRPFFALHDLRIMGFSYYFRERAIELGFQTPTYLWGKVAVVMPKGPIGQLLAKLAKLSLSKSKGNLELEPFTDYEQAVEWLRETW